MKKEYMFELFSSSDSTQFIVLFIFDVFSTLFCLWLAIYAFCNYRITVHPSDRRGKPSSIRKTLREESETIIIPHLYCIGQLAVATGLNSVVFILTTIPEWEQASFCYFINGFQCYTRNAACLWSFTIVSVLYYIILDKKWRNSCSLG